MKILISGGAKTANIANALQKKLESSGIDFMVVPFIEDIPEIFVRGEYFDRAILIEQGWTHDNANTDEYDIRNAVNSFANTMSDINGPNVTYVFLSQTDEMASMVNEEIASIISQSALIVKKPTYYVNFFEKLATFELNQMPREYLYNPNDGYEDVVGDQQNIEDTDAGTYVNKFEQDNGEGNANRLDIDTGNDLEMPSDGGSGTFEDPEFDGEWSSDGQGLAGDNQENLDNTGNWSNQNPEEISKMLNNDWENQQESWEGQNENWEGQQDNWDNQQGDLDNQQDGWDNQQEGWENQQEGWDNQQGDWNDQQDNNHLPTQDLGQDYPPQDYPVRESGVIPDYSGPDPGFNIGSDNWDNQDYDQDPQEPMQNGGFDNSDYSQDNQPTQNEFDSELYNDDTTEEPEPTGKKVVNRPKLNNKQIKASFDAFAARGNSIVVTGFGGSGTSTVAFNLANTICNLGYTVLLVDMDTVNKAQSYISKDNYDAVYSESASIMTAVNSSSGINAYVSVVRQGFHLLTMGMGSDSIKPDKAFIKDKLNRFVQLAKTSHNFVIYDIPFEYAVGHLDAITYSADNIVMTIDSSNWGISKALLNICNIGSDDMEEMLFSRAQLLFNRYRGINKVLGKKVKKIKDITNVMDKKVKELMGEDIGYYFSDMHVCGTIRDDPSFESGWFDEIQYSDTKKGFEMFMDILMRIVLHT